MKNRILCICVFIFGLKKSQPKDGKNELRVASREKGVDCMPFEWNCIIHFFGWFASSREKRVVRTMVAHGACFFVYQIMLGHKMWAKGKCEVGISRL